MEPKNLKDMGRALRKQREAQGLTLTELSFQVRSHLPEPDWVTGEAIRAYEKGSVKRVNVLLLTAIGQVLGFTLADLSPELAADAERLRDLLEAGIRCSRAFAGAA